VDHPHAFLKIKNAGMSASKASMNSKFDGGSSFGGKAQDMNDPEQLLEELVHGNYDPKAEQLKAQQQLVNK
jgi:phage tail tape-measure protein